MPSRKEVLSLIFFREVRANFAAYYSSQIAKANAILKAHGAPDPVTLPAPLTERPPPAMM